MLAVNSPGGVVTGSHQIYHELKTLSEKKPVYVSMKDMAASGGYYISMGIGPSGKIFAEPTTWTGSIGVLLPFYNASGMAEKIGVKSEPLKTGPLKGSLNPFRDMTQQEKDVWTDILDEAFELFLTVIDENRDNLDRAKVEELATGQVYTATQAKENGLIDEIGFEEAALEALKKELGLSSVQVVTYGSPPTVMDVLLGSAEASAPENQWQQAMEMTVPKAMYYCSWLPVMPGTR
jgi:protease-4